MTVISATAANSPITGYNRNVDLACSNAVHGDGHTTDRHGGFCFIRNARESFLSVTPSGWKATVSVVLCPFHHRGTGTIAVKCCGSLLPCCNTCSMNRTSHIRDFHRPGNAFLRRHRLTDTADPATGRQLPTMPISGKRIYRHGYRLD